MTLAQTCYVVTKSKEKLYLIKMFDEHSLFKDLEILCQGEPESGSWKGKEWKWRWTKG